MINRFKDVFAIIGPSMVGPSSSHTAGAVRLGRTARQLLGRQPEEADIVLYGSFAATYRGHGTDQAITAGLLDYGTDDMRIRSAIADAAALGLVPRFSTVLHADQGVHPNTAAFSLRSGDRSVSMTGRSIGGGNIEIVDVEGFDVKFTAHYPTFCIFHADRQGIIADIAGANIGYMEVDRKARSGAALTVIESDAAIRREALNALRRLPSVHRVCVIDLHASEGEVDACDSQP
jgi:L-serine dehydratase